MHAVVVGHTDLGESDRIIRFLTAEGGRVAAVARGARRSKKRFGGALDAGTRVDIALRQGRSNLASLTAVDIRHAPNRARTDMNRIALMLYGCEICAGLAPEDGPAPRLFTLLEVWLDLLEGPHPVGSASRIALEAKALTFAGLCPGLVNCAACGEPLADSAHFDDESGGGLHAWCGTGRPVSADLLTQIDGLRRTPLSQTTACQWNGPEWLIGDFLRYQLGRPVKARALLTDTLVTEKPR